MSQRLPSRRPSRRPYHHGDLKRALIDTALAMVTEEGTWSFTLREVARRAGVSHAAPYNHFADKTELLAEVAALGFQALGRAMETAARRARTAEQALLRIGIVYVRFGVENPAHYRLMFGAELADRERYPALLQAADATFAALTGALERGQATGEVRRGAVREQAVSAWSLVHGLTMLLLDQRLGFLGLSIAEAERQARAAGIALFRGLSAAGQTLPSAADPHT
jgi:AcrR family transcriptional regulator